MIVGYAASSSFDEVACPVFRLIEESRLSSKEIAAIIGVTPPTVSKWRKGRAKIPAARLIFMTLLLAHWLEELERLAERTTITVEAPPELLARMNRHIIAMRRCLTKQESANSSISPKAVREGTRMFRIWWDTVSIKHSGQENVPAGFFLAEPSQSANYINRNPRHTAQ